MLIFDRLCLIECTEKLLCIAILTKLKSNIFLEIIKYKMYTFVTRPAHYTIRVADVHRKCNSCYLYNAPFNQHLGSFC